MSIPLDRDEVSEFTPPSLENVSPKPVFRFRAATVRDQKRYGHALSVEGLRLFPDEAVRNEIRKVLKEQWSPDDYAIHIGRLESSWAKIDQSIQLSMGEAEELLDLSMQCLDVSPMLRRMDADNKRFSDEAPGVALGMFLCGWKNIDTPFRLNAGQLPFETMMALSKDLLALEEKAKKEKVEGVTPGLAFMELSLHAFSLLNFDKATEKNSDAPSPSSETPSGIKSDSTPDGASENTSSAPTKTRSTRSQKKPAASS